jgi:hypothetical protein
VRATLIALLLFAGLLVPAPPALADPCGGQATGTEGGVSARWDPCPDNPGSNPSGPGNPGSNNDDYEPTFWELCQAVGCTWACNDGVDGTPWIEGFGPDGSGLCEFTPDPGDEQGPGPGLPVDPVALAEEAVDRLGLPDPAVRLNPDGDQVVRLATWLWIDSAQWTRERASASAGPVTSTVTATPQRVRWAMGNGDVEECDGPGRPYEPRFAERPDATDCSYEYRNSSAGQPGGVYDITATVEWHLTWTVTGAPGGGPLGVIERSTTVPIRVGELQALVQ